MNYLTIEILQRFPQLYKITPDIFTKTCKEVLDIEVDYNKSWWDQGIVEIIKLTNNPPDFRIVNRINNLDKLLP